MNALLTPFQLLLVSLAGWIHQQHQDMIEYLKEENRVLRELHGKRRLRFSDNQRRRLAVRAKTLGRKTLCELGTIVTPDTLLRWHRQLIVKKYDGMRHVRGPVRKPCFNGKAERFFRTLRGWMRGVLLPIGLRGIQHRLDDFQHWYNTERPHQALDGLAPEEEWGDVVLSEPIVFHTAEKVSPAIVVKRRSCRGDPRLLSVRIRLAA